MTQRQLAGNIGRMEVMRSGLLDRPDWLLSRNMLLISLISYHQCISSSERFGGYVVFLVTLVTANPVAPERRPSHA